MFFLFALRRRKPPLPLFSSSSDTHSMKERPANRHKKHATSNQKSNKTKTKQKTPSHHRLTRFAPRAWTTLANPPLASRCFAGLRLSILRSSGQ